MLHVVHVLKTTLGSSWEYDIKTFSYETKSSSDLFFWHYADDLVGACNGFDPLQIVMLMSYL